MPTNLVNGQDADGLVVVMEDHIHHAQLVYPTLANGTAVVGGAAWTLGNFVEIVPINTIASPFDIHWVNIENATADTAYELVLYNVSAEIGRIRFTRDVAGASTEPLISGPMQTPIIPSNAQIRAKVASAAGGPDTVTVSLCYHIY